MHKWISSILTIQKNFFLEPCQPSNNSVWMEFQRHRVHKYNIWIAHNESCQHWMRFDEHIEWCMHFFHWLYTFCIFIQIIPSNVGRIWYVILCDVMDWLCCILSTFALRNRVGLVVSKEVFQNWNITQLHSVNSHDSEKTLSLNHVNWTTTTAKSIFNNTILT